MFLLRAGEVTLEEKRLMLAAFSFATYEPPSILQPETASSSTLTALPKPPTPIT
jgi:hypothetical protein